jgi:hypothetical protein
VALALLRSISLDSGAKPRCAVAAGARIDLVENDHRRILSLSLLFRHDPDRDHDNDDGDELQQHAKPHELLRCVARAPAHHIDETKEEHHRDGADGEQNNDITQQRRYFPK